MRLSWLGGWVVGLAVCFGGGWLITVNGLGVGRVDQGSFVPLRQLFGMGDASAPVCMVLQVPLHYLHPTRRFVLLLPHHCTTTIEHTPVVACLAATTKQQQKNDCTARNTILGRLCEISHLCTCACTLQRLHALLNCHFVLCCVCKRSALAAVAGASWLSFDRC